MNPQHFSCVAMVTLLFSAFIFNFYGHSPKHRKIGACTALIGGSSFLVAGILYRDPFIIFMELSFMVLNVYGAFKSHREEKAQDAVGRLESIDEYA